MIELNPLDSEVMLMNQVRSIESNSAAVSLPQRCPRSIGSLFSLVVLSVFICYACALDEGRFLEFDSFLERQGALLALFDSLLSTAAAAFLVWSIRNEKRRKIWLAGMLFTLVALAANMADYYGTLQVSPDLALEVSPIWNGLLKYTGFEFAKLYGLFGKIFVSVMAGACLVFYLKNVQRLRPRNPQPLRSLLFHLGEGCNASSQRWLPFATVLAFYFAAVNLFCFYIAYANSLVNDLPSLSHLPPLPAAVCIALALITALFLIVTHAILRSSLQ